MDCRGKEKKKKEKEKEEWKLLPKISRSIA